MNKSKSSSVNVPVVLILVGVVIVFATAATLLTTNPSNNGVANVPVEQAQNAEASFVQDDNNKLVVTDKLLVDGFPPEITPYPNSQLEKSVETTYNNQLHYSAIWKSSAPVRQVVAYFLNQAKEKGWEIRIAPTDPVSEQEEQITVVFNNQTVNITAEKEGALSEPTEIVIDVIPR